MRQDSYSDTLVKETRELYPDDVKVIQMAERGDEFLGAYLRLQSEVYVIEPDELLDAMLDLDFLKNKAKNIKRRKALFLLWEEEMRKRDNIIVSRHEAAGFYFRV